MGEKKITRTITITDIEYVTVDPDNMQASKHRLSTFGKCDGKEAEKAARVVAKGLNSNYMFAGVTGTATREVRYTVPMVAFLRHASFGVCGKGAVAKKVLMIDYNVDYADLTTRAVESTDLVGYFVDTPTDEELLAQASERLDTRIRIPVRVSVNSSDEGIVGMPYDEFISWAVKDVEVNE